MLSPNPPLYLCVQGHHTFLCPDARELIGSLFWPTIVGHEGVAVGVADTTTLLALEGYSAQ